MCLFFLPPPLAVFVFFALRGSGPVHRRLPPLPAAGPPPARSDVAPLGVHWGFPRRLACCRSFFSLSVWRLPPSVAAEAWWRSLVFLRALLDRPVLAVSSKVISCLPRSVPLYVGCPFNCLDSIACLGCGFSCWPGNRVDAAAALGRFGVAWPFCCWMPGDPLYCVIDVQLWPPLRPSPS